MPAPVFYLAGNRTPQVEPGYFVFKWVAITTEIHPWQWDVIWRIQRATLMPTVSI